MTTTGVEGDYSAVTLNLADVASDSECVLQQ